MAVGAGAIGMAAFGSVLAFFVGFGLSLFLSLLPGSTKGMAFMALNKEVWQDRIEENLFQDNQFILKSVDDSQYVDNKTVHIPNAGAPPGVEKNRVIDGTPTNPQKREDSEVTYDIAEFTSDPIIITDAEEKELSYDKMDSELSETQLALDERISEDILINWAPTGTALLADGVTTNNNILRTTGVDRNDLSKPRVKYAAHLPAATGDRLGLCVYDIKQAQTAANKARWPKKGRCALLDSDMYAQLVQDMSTTQYQDFSKVIDPATGVVGQLYGFTFYERNTVLKYTNADLPALRPYGAAGAATDNAAALFWYEGYVSRAIGEGRFFEQKDSPTAYGDMYSTLVRAGGSKRRKTEVGVLAIVQAVPAVEA